MTNDLENKITYVNSLDALELLLFLEKKTTTKLSQKILNGFEIKSKAQSPEMKFLNQSA